MPCLLSLTSPAEGSDLSSVVQLDPPPAVESLGRVREYHRSIVGRLGLGPQPWARPRQVGQALEGTPVAHTRCTEAGGGAVALRGGDQVGVAPLPGPGATEGHAGGAGGGRGLSGRRAGKRQAAAADVAAGGGGTPAQPTTAGGCQKHVRILTDATD